MQMQAHWDWKTGKKVAYSPPAGRSMHNAARSIDVDVKLIEESLNPTGYAKKGFDLYWEIYRDLGFTGVRENAKYACKTATEAWHQDYLGVFTALRKVQGYKIAAIVATMDAIGDNYPGYTHDQIRNYRIQAYLLSFGLYKYTVDGIWGKGTEGALKKYSHRSEENYLRAYVLVREKWMAVLHYSNCWIRGYPISFNESETAKTETYVPFNMQMVVRKDKMY